MRFFILTLILLLVGCAAEAPRLLQSEPFNKCLAEIRLEGGDAWAARQEGGSCCAVAENDLDSTFCTTSPRL